MSLPFSAVLFDGDGVVFDSEELSIEVFREVLGRHGVPFTRRQCDRFIGMGTATFLRILADEYGLVLTEEDFVAQRDGAYRDRCLQHHLPPPMPGIVELLSWLRARGIPWALATSATKEKLDLNFRFSGLREWFPVVALGSEVPHGKPAPDIFLLAAERLQVPPHACLVVEDSLNGLRGGLAAGARVAAIQGSHPDDELLALTPVLYANPGALLRDLQAETGPLFAR